MSDINQVDEGRFLKAYDAHEYDSPLLTVDGVLFTYHEGVVKVLLVERSNYPDKGMWGLPGGFVDLGADKSLEGTMIRTLKAKTGVVPPYIEQLATIGNEHRDKRGWSVTVCYSALIAHQSCQVNITSVNDARWVEIKEAKSLSLAFDHGDILKQGMARLKQKALYSIVPAYALPDKFTLPELQELHEALIGKTLQKRSFRRRIEQADLLIDTGEVRRDGGRPAALYRMKPTSGSHRFVRNLEE
jgi:8-oxo-dGTP diphosphatase